MLAGVSRHEFFDQRYTETGFIRQFEVTINDLGIMIHRALDPGVGEVVEVLLDLEMSFLDPASTYT